MSRPEEFERCVAELLRTSLTQGSDIPDVTTDELADVMVLAGVESSERSPLTMFVQCK